MTKKITIEFRYVDRTACSRCKKTGENTIKIYKKLKNELAKQDINISFKTRKLPLSKLNESNSVLINGKDVNVILENNFNYQSNCHGCSEIMKKPCKCRMYTHKGKAYSHITSKMIKEAIMKVLKR